MFRLILICNFLFALNTFATSPCTDPFSGRYAHFTLTEPLSGDPTQSRYRLNISPGVYLEPSCIGNQKVLDLYFNNGANIRSFSNEQAGQSGWGSLTISSACDGQNLFTISADYQIPGIGYVRPEENTVNNVVLRNNQTQVIANASKSLVLEGLGGKAIWSVTNNPGLSPQVMAYLLALKDNQMFSCNASPNSPASTGVSAGTVVGITIAIVVPAITGSLFLYRWIHRNYPAFFKLKTSESPETNMT